MMDEARQIHALLSSPTFWDDDQHRSWSMSMVGGISVGIDRKGETWTWSMTGVDGSVKLSPQAFPTVKEAKTALREEVMRRRECVVEAMAQNAGPASVSY